MISQIDYVRKTQESLGSVIKKPPLTEKLLVKPPFRFLHDVVTSVAKADPDLLAGLYDQNELDWQQVNDRDKKIAFLQKLIDKLKSLGYETNVKPSKIVAGQEPEKTNELLRQLALAAKGSSCQRQQTKKSETKRTTSTEKSKTKVSEVKTAENMHDGQEATSSAGSNKENHANAKKITEPEKPAAKEKQAVKSTSRERKPKDASSANKTTSSKKLSADLKTVVPAKVNESTEPKAKIKEKSSSKERMVEKKVDPLKETPVVNGINDEPVKQKSSEQKKHTEKSEHRENETTIKTSSNNDKLPNDIQINDSPELSNSNDKSDLEEKTGKTINISSERRRTLTINDSPQRTVVSAVETRVDQSENVNDELYIPRPGSVLRQTVSARPSSSAPRTVRPPTATRREPLVRGLNKTQLTNYESSSKKALAKNSEINSANVTLTPEVQVIAENSNVGNKNDEDDDFIINQDDSDRVENFGVDSIDPNTNLISEDTEHGQLVRKILETKKDLENQIGIEKSTAAASVIYDPNEKEKTRKECSKLQENVQQLTKNTLLLSKLAEFLRDDVESMLGELKQWKAEYRKNMHEIKRQMGKNNDEKEILQKKLSDLDQRLSDQIESASATKGRLFKNREKILKMVTATIKR